VGRSLIKGIKKEIVGYWGRTNATRYLPLPGFDNVAQKSNNKSSKMPRGEDREHPISGGALFNLMWGRITTVRYLPLPFASTVPISKLQANEEAPIVVQNFFSPTDTKMLKSRFQVCQHTNATLRHSLASGHHNDAKVGVGVSVQAFAVAMESFRVNKSKESFGGRRSSSLRPLSSNVLCCSKPPSNPLYAGVR
jgi:hypothetical protein